MPVRVEEASKCPKCKIVGVLQSTEHIGAMDPRGDGKEWDLAAYVCATEGCEWFGTGWAVQSDADGFVFERERGERGMDKTFTTLSPDLKSAGRRYLEDIVNRDLEEPFDPENPHEIPNQ